MLPHDLFSTESLPPKIQSKFRVQTQKRSKYYIINMYLTKPIIPTYRHYERRSSDVSTIGLDEKPVFRPIRSQPNSTKSFKPKSGDSDKGTPYARNTSKPPKPSKNIEKTSYTKPKRTSPLQSYSSQKSYGSEHGSFANIGSIKSASNSMIRAQSNFDINAK